MTVDWINHITGSYDYHIIIIKIAQRFYPISLKTYQIRYLLYLVFLYFKLYKSLTNI